MIYVGGDIIGSGSIVEEPMWIPAPSAGGFTARVTNNGATFDSQTINRASSNAACSVKFTAPATCTLTKGDIRLFKTGSPTFDLILAIYSDSSNLPGTLIGTPSDTFNAAGLPSSESTDSSFINLSANIVNATAYWALLYKSGGADNYFVDFVNWPFQNSGGGSPPVNYVSTYTPTTWAEGNVVGGFIMPGKMILYSTP